jgi:hypothetical protein
MCNYYSERQRTINIGTGFYANKIFQVEDNKEIYKCNIYGENLDVITTLFKKFDTIQNNNLEYSYS